MHLWIQCMVIRASRDQLAFDQSPGLIAVFHALHRLLAPRHPPHALSSLAALFLSSRPPAGPVDRERSGLLALIFRRSQGKVTIQFSTSKARVDRTTHSAAPCGNVR